LAILLETFSIAFYCFHIHSNVTLFSVTDNIKIAFFRVLWEIFKDRTYYGDPYWNRLNVFYTNSQSIPFLPDYQPGASGFYFDGKDRDDAIPKTVGINSLLRRGNTVSIPRTVQVTFVVIEHEIFSTVIRTLPLLWYVYTQKFQFLAKMKANGTGKLLDSLQ
jgi:hypothetical protein